MSTLYVGNLAWGTTAETLQWAIIECAAAQDATNIIHMCNGADVDGRTITVRLDNKPEKAGGNASGGGGKGGAGRQGDPALVGKAENSTGTQIVVRNLAWNVTSDMLRGTFEQIGTVSDAEVVYHSDSGRSKGWGTVRFSTQEDAQDAIQRFGGVELAGRPMVCRMDRYN